MEDKELNYVMINQNDSSIFEYELINIIVEKLLYELYYTKEKFNYEHSSIL